MRGRGNAVSQKQKRRDVERDGGDIFGNYGFVMVLRW
jgi:hypothetical protein